MLIYLGFGTMECLSSYMLYQSTRYVVSDSKSFLDQADGSGLIYVKTHLFGLSQIP